ncbi:ABC-type transport system, involved in lipoprotein release, permease component [Lachnospiraceae bacterium JC7]|nr:ABC-type transport system, involved in lipoprotein release, permease component [Lachnospiraceae bacterium JC7]
MKQFRKNALRLAWRNKGSLFGSVFIIAIGIMTMVSMFDTLTNLKGQIQELYKERKLTDVFATVIGISEADLERFTELPGIREAGGKIASDVRLVTDDQEEIVTVHLMSYSKYDRVNLSSLTLDDGKGERVLPPGSEFTADNAIFLGASMEKIYDFSPGDEIRLVVNGKSHRFAYAGTVNEPDYIYAMPPGGAMIPDGSTYDIAVISRDKMEKMMDSSNLTEIGFILEDGYEYADVKRKLEDRLQPYGLQSLCEKEHQASFQEMEGEFEELSSMGTVIPFLFMSISVFMLYVVLNKMIDRDRSLIGTMKAFGMTDMELMGAYMMQGLVIGILGALAGCIFASPFGRSMFDLYRSFYNLPDPVYYEPVISKLLAFLIAIATSVAAVFAGIRGILGITPSMAMRARSPQVFGEMKLPAFLGEHIRFMTKMGLMSILRNPFRGFLIALAIGFPFAMSSVLFSYGPLINSVMVSEYDNCKAYDLEAQLDRYSSPGKVLDSAETLMHVRSAEPVFERAVMLRKDSQSDYSLLSGLPDGSDLWKVLDNEKMEYIDIPEDGLLINERLANKLHVKEGDRVEFSIPGLVTGWRDVRVSGVLSETFGSRCYLKLDCFPDVLGIDSMADILLISAEPGHFDEVKKELYDSGRVTWIVDKLKTRRTFSDMFRSMTIMVDVFNILSVIAGVILIYNISMINLRERTTELVTLRVLGTTDRELGWMLWFEMMVYFAAGILMGVPGNYFIRKLFESMMKTDSYVFRMKFDPPSSVYAFLLCGVISVIAWFLEMRLVKSIKLTDALKERE